MEAYSLQNRDKAGGSALARPEFIQAQVVSSDAPLLIIKTFPLCFILAILIFRMRSWQPDWYTIWAQWSFAT